MHKNQQIIGIKVWLTCALFFTYEFLLRTVIGTLQPGLMQDLQLSSFSFAILSTTAYLVIYGAMQIPVGVIVDNFGLKKSLSLGCSACIISCLWFALAQSYISALFARTLMGFGSAFGFICLLVAVYEWLPNKNIALFIGLSQFIGTLGPMIAAGPIATLAHSGEVSWRTIFLYLSLAGCFLLGLIILFVKNNTSTKGKYLILVRPEAILQRLSRLFLRAQPWLIATFSGLVYFTVEYLSENEGKIFLALKGLTHVTSSYMITCSWIGYACGCPLMGFLSDKYQRRKPFLVISSVFNLLGIIVVTFSKQTNILFFGFMLLGLGASGQSIAFATIVEHFKQSNRAVALGLNNAITTTLAGLNAPLLGLAIDGFVHSGFSQYFSYMYTFCFIIAFAIIALIISSCFIKESFAKSKVDFTYLNY